MSNVEVYQGGTAPVQWSPEQVELIRQQICPGASDDELKFFAKVCEHKQLDPFLGEIVGIMRWDGKAKNPDGSLGREVMKIQETVEGLRTIAERSGQYGGFRGPQWTADGQTWVDVWLDETKPPAAARYWVIRKDWVEPAPGVARWASNVQVYKDRNGAVHMTPLWRDRPDEMLAKCAEVRALKRAFTKEFARADISVRDLSDASIVTMEARQAGLDDDDRRALVAEITEGRTESTTELTDDETLKVRQEVAKRVPAQHTGGGVSPQCGASQHGTCPGYYKTAHRCHCACHQKNPDAVRRTIARGVADLEARLELLNQDQMETIKYWRRQQGLIKPVGTMKLDERARIAAELDARGWGDGYDYEPEEAGDQEEGVVPDDVVEPGMFDEDP